MTWGGSPANLAPRRPRRLTSPRLAGTLIAHTDDAGGNPNDLRLVKVPAKDHAPGALRAVYPDDAGYPRIVDASRAAGYAPEPGQLPSTPIGFVPEVAHTYAYWDQDYGLMNEKQVAMAESTCGARFGGGPADRAAHRRARDERSWPALGRVGAVEGAVSRALSPRRYARAAQRLPQRGVQARDRR